MTVTRKHDLIAACALTVLPLIIFFDVAFLGSGFFLRDISSYFIPTQATVRACAVGGEFPFWNPLVAGGQGSLTHLPLSCTRTSPGARGTG